MEVREGVGEVQEALEMVTELGVEDGGKGGRNFIWDVRMGFCLNVF